MSDTYHRRDRYLAAKAALADLQSAMTEVAVKVEAVSERFGPCEKLRKASGRLLLAIDECENTLHSTYQAEMVARALEIWAAE